MSCSIERQACLCAKVVIFAEILGISLAASIGFATNERFLLAANRDSNSDSGAIRHRNFAEPIRFQDGSRLQYVGTFSSDARFTTPSKLTRYAESVGSGPAPEVRQDSAPTSLVRCYERKVEAFAPPARASARLESESLPHGALASVVTFLYGHAKVLQAPTSVSTDSKGRAILIDPAANAVHVVDPQKKDSFRIMSGPQRRLRSPQDVAVDADDNIYVADSSRASIVVFDRNGRFLREMSSHRDEYSYGSITGIAIDAAAGRLYLADGSQSEIFMLDLEGKVLRVLGRRKGSGAPGQLQVRPRVNPDAFDAPLDIAVSAQEVVVLDQRGMRVEVMDTDGKLIHSFPVQRAQHDHGSAVALDQDGNIYVSYPDDAAVRVFNQEGTLLGSFGHTPFRTDDIASPSGIWIDAYNRVYVSDRKNARIQVYQRQGPPAGSHMMVRSHP